MNRRNAILLFLTLTVFAVWFGGLTFYAGVVVPIGTDILGSARAQGEVTQQVTFWLNWIGTFAIGLLWMDLFSRHWDSAELAAQPFYVRRRFQAVVLGVMAVAQIGLFLVHTELSQKIALIDGQLRIKERSEFYSLHQIYLWITILHWLGGLIWLAGIARVLVPPDLKLAKETGTRRES